MQAWERKNYHQHQKSIIPKKNIYSFTYLLEIHHAGPQVYMDLKEKINKETRYIYKTHITATSTAFDAHICRHRSSLSPP